MGINRDKPDLWKKDIEKSVDLYNDWFLHFAPKAFRDTRSLAQERVADALAATDFLRDISPAMLRAHPDALPILRMSTCPPIARDRLVGLAGVSKNLVKGMEDAEDPRVPPKMKEGRLERELMKISSAISEMADRDIFTWLDVGCKPSGGEISRAAAIVADRLCGSLANPIIRNAQEKRQLEVISKILRAKGYKLAKSGTRYNEMARGEFSFHANIPARVADGGDVKVDISVDVIAMPFSSTSRDMPILIEAKSAGDFTNVNKRRKEEAEKMRQLRDTFGDDVSYSLFLCGYFDTGYLGYEAAEGIDWIWEHRAEDLLCLGL